MRLSYHTNSSRERERAQAARVLLQRRPGQAREYHEGKLVEMVTQEIALSLLLSLSHQHNPSMQVIAAFRSSHTYRQMSCCACQSTVSIMWSFGSRKRAKEREVKSGQASNRVARSKVRVLVNFAVCRVFVRSCVVLEGGV